MEAVVNHNLKGYELRERIGAGGFGAVYRAYQSTVGREVAIKVILPGLANQPDFIRRFEGEAQVVARLEHPHITPLYDYWRDPEGAYLVMRWLKGGSLRDVLEQAAFDLRSAALLLDQIAGALSLAHRNNIIHRDIKPGNILLDEDGNAYLTDFGIAKDLNLLGNNTQPDAIVGSLDYISPEQARSEPITARTDIYSLGVTLYEVITGQHPFENLSPIERLYKHINDPLPEITSLNAPVNSQVNRVIQKATAKNPEHRYVDALAFAADFREAVGLNRMPTAVELLTQREQETLQLIIDGLSNKEIAARLTVTLSTVKSHVNQIYAKLGVRSRVQAMVRARELNLLTKASESPSLVQIPTEDFQPENPYKGLRAFQSADNQDFFGREKVTAKLVKRLEETHEFVRFLAIIGPSGSGKSSLVKAGLIPALWRGELLGSEKWFVVELLPGAHPLDELEVALIRVAASNTGHLKEHLSRDRRGLIRAAQLILPADGSELVLVIDQFEEVFTLLQDEAERVQFLDLLYTAVTEPRSRVRIILTLRADFYDRPLYYPEFGELVRSRLETIMPLSAEELERAITYPAKRVGVTFEPGLAAGIIGDVNYQPGALPLLQYALTELFEQRQGHLLKHEAYQAIGGTVGALAKRADEIYLDLDETEQEAARQMFLRLVTLGEGTEDTRRRAARSELLALVPDSEVMDDVLDTYADYRLLSLDNDPGAHTPTVEVAHEALLREWERLRTWLKESREDVRLQRQVLALANEWYNTKQEASFLLHGSRLEIFEKWVQNTQLALTEKEREFINASLTKRTKEALAEENRQVHELQLAQNTAKAERRASNRLRLLVAVMVVATIGALVLMVFALNERAKSEMNFNRAEQQRLYLVAGNAMDGNATGNVGLVLALRSLTYGYIPGADAALMRASRQGIVQQNLTGHQFELYGVVYSPDGSLIATSSEGGTRVYDTVMGEELYLLPQEGITYSVVFSPDGTNILTAGSEGDVRLWDTATGTLIRTYLNDTSVYFAYFTPNGLQLISSMADSYQVWDVLSGSRLEAYPTVIDDSHELIGLLYDKNGGLQFVIDDADNRVYIEDPQTEEVTCTLLDANVAHWQALSWTDQDETGHWIAILATDENIAYAWNLETCLLLAQFTGHTSPILNADYDPHQDVVVTVDTSGIAIQWDIRTGQEIARYVTNGSRGRLDISPDGQSLLMPQWNIAAVWDMAFPQEPRSIVTNQENLTFFPRFSPDGESLYIGGFGTYSRWNLSEASATPIITYEQPIRVLDISPDGQYLFVAIEWVTDPDYSTYLIDANTGSTIREFVGHSEDVNFLDFSPDGTQVVSGSFDLTARIWDVATGETLQVLTGHTGVVSSAMFSPDGRSVLTTSSDGTVRLWDTTTGEALKIMDIGTPIPYAAFSPNGRLIAAADTEGFGHILDATSGETLHTLVGHTDTLWSARFSPDGTQVVTASWDGTARIWDVETGELIRVLDNGNYNALYWAEFSPDGNYVVTGSEFDNRVYLWRVDLDDVITSFCEHHPLDLTTEQRVQYGVTDDHPVCP